MSEKFNPWCIICGKGFKTRKKAKKHYQLCISEDWIRLNKENDRLKEHLVVWEMKCLRLQEEIKKLRKPLKRRKK